MDKYNNEKSTILSLLATYTLKITWTILMQKKKQYGKKGHSFFISSIFFSWMVPSYGVYISQFIIPFARVCDNVSGFNNRNLVRTEKNFYTKSDISKLVKYFKKTLFVKAVI